MSSWLCEQQKEIEPESRKKGVWKEKNVEKEAIMDWNRREKKTAQAGKDESTKIEMKF
jgi:hypothetical protein